MKKLLLASACLLLLAGACNQKQLIDGRFATEDEKIQAVKALLEADGMKVFDSDTARAILLSYNYDSLKASIEKAALENKERKPMTQEELEQAAEPFLQYVALEKRLAEVEQMRDSILQQMKALEKEYGIVSDKQMAANKEAILKANNMTEEELNAM